MARKTIDDIRTDRQYIAWQAKQSPRLSTKKLNELTAATKKLVHRDLQVQMKMDVKENTTYHKYLELREWLPKQKEKDLRWVERLIWKPKGRSDFRRIQPELIDVNAYYEVDAYNIWGEKETEVYEPHDSLAKHWEILRVLVSRARYDGFPGRLLKLLVRDKVTKKYLGVIALSSDFTAMTERNKSIGTNLDQLLRDKHPFNLTANGQTIVPTQPFGSAFLGGKLLALLCLSKEAATAWKKAYGDTLVGVTTTSLYGGKDRRSTTQYDGLTPYWKKFGSTKAEVPVKLTDEVFKSVCVWMQATYPEYFWRDKVRTHKDSKNKIIRFAYQKFEFGEALSAGFKRDVYFSRLYKNTDEYIANYAACCYDPTVAKMPVSNLIPAFDNSAAALTEHWRYGHAGDTTGSPPELVKKYGDNIRRLVKGRLDRGEKEQRLIPTEGLPIAWYEEMGAKRTWKEAQLWERERTKSLGSTED